MDAALTFDRAARLPAKPRVRSYLVLPGWVWIVVAALCVHGLFTPNPTLTVLAILTLVVSVQLLWRRGEPPVLVFACGMQWLQAAGSIFYCNSYGLTLEQAAGGTWQYSQATLLSLVAVAALAAGMRIGLIGAAAPSPDHLMVEGRSVILGHAFVFYLVAFGIASVATVAGWLVPSITQLILALVPLKWMGVFILSYAVLEQRRGYGLLAWCIFLEVGTGLISYFASFKSVFFIVLIVALTSPLALKGRRMALTIIIAGTVFCLGIVWTAIKRDYREFVNQGTNTQVVSVTASESIDQLADLVAKLNWQDISDGLENMILRVSYTQFFAQAIVNVPTAIPFERGKLWSETIERVLMPRLFFPDKAVVDDSERTRLYTGIDVAGIEQGTSIGLGYVAESYIDFGQTLMFAPIILLGLFFGLIYRFLVISSKRKLLGAGIASAIIVFQAYTIETSNIKIVGGTVAQLLVMIPLYCIFGGSLSRLLQSDAVNRSPGSPG